MKAYSAPSAPKAPSLPADLASELAAYDVAEPSKADAAAAPAAHGEAGAGAEAFLGFLEADIPTAEAHH